LSPARAHHLWSPAKASLVRVRPDLISMGINRFPRSARRSTSLPLLSRQNENAGFSPRFSSALISSEQIQQLSRSAGTKSDKTLERFHILNIEHLPDIPFHIGRYISAVPCCGRQSAIIDGRVASGQHHRIDVIRQYACIGQLRHGEREQFRKIGCCVALHPSLLRRT
jgi:hypothetical protein